MATRTQVKQATFLANLQYVLGQNIRQYGPVRHHDHLFDHDERYLYFVA